MQQELLNLLRCPFAKSKLSIKVIATGTKAFGNELKTVITEAILFSDAGFVFPVINGIPRMLLEAIDDYAGFLQQHLHDYALRRKNLEATHAGVLAYCKSKNQQTKKSFFVEWSFLQPTQKDKLWHEDIDALQNRFLLEAGCKKEELAQKLAIDIGSGHGITTNKIAGTTGFAVGIELSRAVEEAYNRNSNCNAHYLQGDLQFIPFENHSFDFLYSSGVLHHTNNTRNSLGIVEQLVKPYGRICIWLYHPQNNRIHAAMLALRKITTRLPFWITFVLLQLFVFPLSFVIKRMKRKVKPNYREEMIDLLDMFTPKYRFETDHQTAEAWLGELNYHSINITTTDQFGFSITGIKQQ
ncbi:MAG: methyltransferase domain-containing protein [Lacibacter sp.]